MRIEIVRQGKPTARIIHLMGVSDIKNELSYTPKVELVVSLIEDARPWDEVRFHHSDKVFQGVITDLAPDYDNMTMTITATHIIQEWERVQLPTNRAIKFVQLRDVMAHPEFRPAAWNVDLQNDLADYYIDYVFSKETQLDALTTITEMTPYAHWRVNPHIAGRNIEVGQFGEKSGYVFSAHRQGNGIMPIIRVSSSGVNFSRVKNKAVVYAQKSDSGMPSMSLRDVYVRPELQLPEFPIEVIRDDCNNERSYDYSDEYPAIAPNQNIEYAIRDTHSIATEGLEIETTLSFATLSPFATDNELVSDEDRIKSAHVAYLSAVKQLIQLRRYEDMRITTGGIPPNLLPGDRVYIEFEPTKKRFLECTQISENFVGYTGYKYVKEINTAIDEVTGAETNTITLDDYIRVDRETATSNAIIDGINRTGERSAVNGRLLGRVQLQRQNQVVDNYGIEYTSHGSATANAYFLIPVSPDMIFIERFQFRLILEPTRVAIGNLQALSSATVAVNHTELTVTPLASTTTGLTALALTRDEAGLVEGITPPTHNHTIPGHNHTINPASHNHTTQPHTHAIETGVTDVPIQADTFGITIDGHDITTLIQSLYPGQWLNQNGGIFPTSVDHFDLLKVASVSSRAVAQAILSGGDKRIEISGNGTFSVRFIKYVKYNYVNR